MEKTPVIFNYVTGNVDITSKSGLADTILIFFQWQAMEAHKEAMGAENRVISAINANKTAAEEWHDEYSCGFGPPQPFSPEQINQFEIEAAEKAKLHAGMEALNKFVRKSLLEKYIKD